MTKKPEGAAELQAVASIVQRLAVLLAAGVTPSSAWGYLVEVQPSGPTLRPGLAEPPGVLQLVVDSIGTGRSVSDAILDAVHGSPATLADAWRGLGAAWFVATEAGAPLAPTLRDLAGSLRDLAQTGREVQVAIAAPVATARMVMVLPVVGILFGIALGFDTLRTLFATPLGLSCLLLGAVLMAAARAWNSRLVRAAQPAETTPGLAIDLVAIAVGGGASIARARSAVDEACARFGLASAGDAETVDGILALSQRAGVPAAALLRSQADEARRSARNDGATRAATLAVKLMLPLGLCILPAFMLLGVAPLLISVISSTVSAF